MAYGLKKGFNMELPNDLITINEASCLYALPKSFFKYRLDNEVYKNYIIDGVRFFSKSEHDGYELPSKLIEYPDNLITVQTAARILGITQTGVRNKFQYKTLWHCKIGSRVFLNKSQVDHYSKNRKVVYDREKFGHGKRK